MRIAYISLHWVRAAESSVGMKILRQTESWRKARHEVEFFMHTLTPDPRENLLPGKIFPYQKGNMLATEYRRSRAARAMLAELAKYQPDVVYLRSAIYVHPMYKLAKIAPLVIEINTNDLVEHRRLGKVYHFYNLLTRGVMFSRASGFVMVSHELAKDPAFAKYRHPAQVIPNGVDLSAITPLPAPNNPVPRLLFAGTPGYGWHGLDKLVELARAHPDLHIEVAGEDALPGFESLPPNLTLLGYLRGRAYINALARADVAMATLALHRKGMQEASPLKTREYLAYGLPVVLPYDDSDLNDLQADFLLKIPNTEDNIRAHGEAIRDFAYAMRGRRADRAQLSMLDDAYKEQKRLDFLQAMAHGGTSA